MTALMPEKDIDLETMDERARAVQRMRADREAGRTVMSVAHLLMDLDAATEQALRDVRTLAAELRLSRTAHRIAIAALVECGTQLRHRDRTITDLREIIHAGTAGGASR
ncbi:MAG: hypothetical protein H0U66_03165 [Gemmatimonadaceae bacterium]|nr:hypothetical protein [Gemmatimonadaceae bacterium]